MLKIWGRNTSSNVQKVMWAIGEMKLPHRAHRRRRRVRQEQGAALSRDESQLRSCRRWRRRTASRCGNRTRSCAISPPSTATARSSPPTCKTRARAHKWMDWQLSVMGPAITPVFWGLIRTPPEKRDANAIAAGKVKTVAAAQDARRPARQDQISRRRRVLLRRHSGRHHDLPLSCSSFRSGRRRQTWTAGMRRSRRARRSRSRSARCR